MELHMEIPATSDRGYGNRYTVARPANYSNLNIALIKEYDRDATSANVLAISSASMLQFNSPIRFQLLVRGGDHLGLARKINPQL